MADMLPSAMFRRNGRVENEPGGRAHAEAHWRRMHRDLSKAVGAHSAQSFLLNAAVSMAAQDVDLDTEWLFGFIAKLHLEY